MASSAAAGAGAKPHGAGAGSDVKAKAVGAPTGDAASAVCAPQLSQAYPASLSITNVLLMEEALGRGWRAEILNLKQDMVLLHPPAPERYILIRRATTELTTALGAVIAHDKHMTYTMAQHCGVPYPQSLVFSEKDWPAAIAFVAAHKHCVVKPTDRAHGDGVSTEVRDEASLRAAIAHAKVQSNNIVIQKWVGGHDYRILVLNNKVVAAARRRPPFVVGDGKRSIRELISAKNAHPWRGEGHSSPLTRIDAKEVEAYLQQQQPAADGTHNSLDTVPAAGLDLELLGTANLSRGGEAIDVTDVLHPDVRELAVRIASACQMGLVGVDFRLTDPTAPPAVSCPALLEVNLTPGLRMHHYPGVGTGRNAAGMVIDEILRRRAVQRAAEALAAAVAAGAAAAGPVGAGAAVQPHSQPAPKRA